MAMNYGKWFESTMGMSDATWKQHANPWSVWTRIPILPLLVLAIWSRAWIGWWCLVPILVLVAWTFANPRAFGPPSSTDNWASKATFGERVWLNRKTLPIPDHHARMSLLLNVVTTLGVIPLIYGLVAYNVLAVILGLVLIILGKLWFLDRMVWLYQDIGDQNREYASWLY
jgi:uncharacterized protein DUF6653